MKWKEMDHFWTFTVLKICLICLFNKFSHVPKKTHQASQGSVVPRQENSWQISDPDAEQEEMENPELPHGSPGASTNDTPR